MFDFQALFDSFREISDYLMHLWHQLEKYSAPAIVVSSMVYRNVPTLTLLLALVVVVHNWLTAAH